MNFTTAYSLLVNGYRITKPGLAYELYMERGTLYQKNKYGEHPVEQFNACMIHMFAQNDWMLVDEQDNLDRIANKKIEILFKRIQKEGWAEPVAPFHAHPDDRGFDLTCVAKELKSDYVWCYHTGLAFSFPDGVDGEIRARSSVYKTGLILSNGVGTIDHGYTGEVQAVFYEMLINTRGCDHYKIGDRFAQLVIPGVDPRDIVFKEVQELPITARGDGGYGSTGK